MKQISRIAFLAGVAAAAPLAGAVRVWEGTLTIPVYEEGPPDVNPPFDSFTNSRFNYPYTLRTNLTGTRAVKNLRALYLENEYLKCSVLPDIGGHLYSCTDKTSGKEMFYANPSIKKALIGMRGTWAAFGIEFNFPVSHNWMSMSPVDFATRQNGDGSASIFIGNIDRPYGMQWMVELVLRPASMLLEEKVTLYNRSDLRRRYYYWNNAAVEVTNQSRICYPMRWTASHGFTFVDTWPVNLAGRDLSIVGNHTAGPVSEFFHGTREGFQGIWHPETDTGVVHYADFAALPGRKIWSFGVDADGLDWHKALSDNDSGYVEVQAGPYRNQETYSFLAPQDELRFSEYWMPVRGTGGISRANVEGVVKLERGGGKLTAKLNVNRLIPDGVMRLSYGGRVLAQYTGRMDPAAVLGLGPVEAPAGKATFELTEKGRRLLAHTEDSYDFADPSEIKTGPQAPVNRDKDPLELGTHQELDGALLAAYATFTGALDKDPRNFELNKAAGRLAVALKNYGDALRFLKRAEARSTSDAEIHYYLGHAYYEAGDSKKAGAEWDYAQIQPPFRAPARLMLGRLAAHDGDPARGLELIRSALAENSAMPRAGAMEVALLRTLGRADEARQRCQYWLERDPLSNWLRLERVKLAGGDEALWRHLAADPERVMEVVVDYLNLGLYRDALELLSRKYPAVPPDEAEPGSALPQDYALVAYYRGWVREKVGESGAEDYALGSKQSSNWVFPNRPETFVVLKRALAVNPGDALPHYYLGNLYMSGGMADKAIGEWEAARRLNPRIPVLHRNLGRTLMVVKHEDARALEAFREGLPIDRRNAELYAGMSQAQAILKRPAMERVKVLEAWPDRAKMPTPLVYDLALSYAEAGRFAESGEMFRDRFFEREEGGTNVRQVYLETQMLQALALAREGAKDRARDVAARFGKAAPGLAFTEDGMAVFIEEARFQYYLGELESLLGGEAAAKAHWRRAEASGGAYAVLAASKLGEDGWRDKAEAMIGGRSGAGHRAAGAVDRALLLQLLKRDEEAENLLDGVLRQPDNRMSHYLARRALLKQ